MEWREENGVRWLEASLPGATAAFSTRVGGTSQGDFATLNVGLLTDDDPEAVYMNRGRLVTALGRDPEGVLFGHQVHGNEVLRRDAAPAPNPFTTPTPLRDKVDGQATQTPGLTPLVQVADCLPVALAGERGVAMLHCGWRGLAGGIVERGAEEVGATAAAIGPGIGACCYEVGQEVLDEFAGLDGVADGRMLDLVAVTRQLLGRAEVKTIEDADLCTSCNPELFFSHRRDAGRTGRQAGLVWMNQAPQRRRGSANASHA